MKRSLIGTVSWVCVVTACGGQRDELGAGEPTSSGGNAGASSSSGATGDSTSPVGELAIPPDQTSLARGPACDFYPCFEACGRKIAAAPVEPAFGFASDRSIPWGVRDVTPLGGDSVLVLTMLSAEVRSATDMSLLGSVPVPDGFQAATVGDRALVQANRGGLALLDLSSAAAPRVSAWWFEAGDLEPNLSLLEAFEAGDLEPNLWLIGAVEAGLLLRTRGGVSLLALDDAGRARELHCIPTTGYPVAALAGDVLALTDSGNLDDTPMQGALYRVSAEGARAIGSVPIDDETPFIGAGSRLAVLSNIGRTLSVYDVSGSAPEAVAVRNDLPQVGSGRLSAGGFVFFGEGAEEIAIDLAGELEVYDVEPVAESECFTRLVPRAAGTTVMVSPLLPGRRLSGEVLPFESCPALHTYHDSPTGALSPDGQSLWFASTYSDYRLILRDLLSGEQQSFAGPIAGDLYWIGDRLIGAITEGHDYDILVTSRLELSSIDDPVTSLGSVPSPGPFIALRATRSELWALSYAEDYIFGEEPPSQRVLWRLDPTEAAPAPVRFDDLDVGSVRTLEVAGDRLYLIGETAVHVVDRDGFELARLDLAAPLTSSAAAEPGLFVLDGSSTLFWLRRDASALTPLVQDCAGCTLLGADATRVYVSTSSPRDAHHPLLRQFDPFLSYTELRAYDLDGVLVGRHPIPPTEDPLLTSASRIVSISGTITVLEPSP